jgi:hypothetical protein
VSSGALCLYMSSFANVEYHTGVQLLNLEGCSNERTPCEQNLAITQRKRSNPNKHMRTRNVSWWNPIHVVAAACLAFWCTHLLLAHPEITSCFNTCPSSSIRSSFHPRYLLLPSRYSSFDRHDIHRSNAARRPLKSPRSLDSLLQPLFANLKHRSTRYRNRYSPIMSNVVAPFAKYSSHLHNL